MKRSSLAVFVTKSNPLSQKEQISFSDLRSESFIAFSSDVDSEYILLLNRLAAEAGFIPRISCYVPNENSFKINLIMGNGVVLGRRTVDDLLGHLQLPRVRDKRGL